MCVHLCMRAFVLDNAHLVLTCAHVIVSPPQTGNELDSPFSWTQLIAGAIKVSGGSTSLSHSFHPACLPIEPFSARATQMMARQLVIDGRQGVNPRSLKSSYVDIVSKHYYPSGDGKRFRECLQEDLKVRAS